MPINYNDTDIINDYLEGNIENTTYTNFNEELDRNPELAEEVEWHKNFKEAVFLVEKEKLQQRTLELIEKEKNKNPNKPKVVSLKTSWRSKSRYLAIAAMLVTAIALIFLFLPKNDSSLTAQYLSEPHSTPVSTRDSADADWIDAYKNKQYNRVISILSQQEQTDPLNAEQKFYLGLTYLYQDANQTPKAIQYLKAAQQENPTFYKDNSNWYIALAHLQAKQKEAAKKYLQEIVAKKSWKHQEAQKLLDEL